MVGDILQPTHLIFILLIALLVLGPKRLPEVGRSLGKGIRDFRGALSGLDDPTEVTPPPPPPTYDPPPSPPPFDEPTPPAPDEAATVSHTYDTATDTHAHEAETEVIHAAPTSPAPVSTAANASKVARADVDPADPAEYAD